LRPFGTQVLARRALDRSPAIVEVEKMLAAAGRDHEEDAAAVSAASNTRPASGSGRRFQALRS
jgi:hypothetical protein